MMKFISQQAGSSAVYWRTEDVRRASKQTLLSEQLGERDAPKSAAEAPKEFPAIRRSSM